MRARWISAMALFLTVLLIPPTTMLVRAQSRKVFRISMVSYKFVPSLITVNRGDTVVLQMVNEDAEGRNHSIAARVFLQTPVVARGDFRTGVGEDRRFFAAEPGKQFELEFVATQAGTFPFVCGIFDHGARGEVGAINVVAGGAP